MRNLTAATLMPALLLAACASARPVARIHNEIHRYGPPVVLAFGAPWVDRTLLVEGYAPVTILGKHYYCDRPEGQPRQWRWIRTSSCVPAREAEAHIFYRYPSGRYY